MAGGIDMEAERGPGVAATGGVLGRRFVAYLLDLAVITGLTVLLGLLVGILGIVTLGAAWILYAVLVPATAIGYSALTVGSSAGATVGMRMMGLVARDAGDGGPVSPLLAGLHALLFYVGVGTFLLLVVDLAFGFVRRDRRLGHDLVAGIVLVRR